MLVRMARVITMLRRWRERYVSFMPADARRRHAAALAMRLMVAARQQEIAALRLTRERAAFTARYFACYAVTTPCYQTAAAMRRQRYDAARPISALAPHAHSALAICLICQVRRRCRADEHYIIMMPLL